MTVSMASHGIIALIQYLQLTAKGDYDFEFVCSKNINVVMKFALLFIVNRKLGLIDDRSHSKFCVKTNLYWVCA